jgi:hypothetical protein
MNRTSTDTTKRHNRNSARMAIACALVAGLALPNSALAFASASDSSSTQAAQPVTSNEAAAIQTSALMSNASVQEGWDSDERGSFYVNEDGARVTGWFADGDTWYLFDEDGYLLSGWQYVDGSWYYLDAEGAMQTGWQYLDGAWYFLGASGRMHTGWFVYGDCWYHLDASVRMAQGWIADEGSWYYLDASGYMYAATTTPDGYYVLENGAWDGRDPGESSFVQEWTQRVDAYLAGSATAGCGAYYAQAAWDYGVDPRILPAISCIESGKGAVCWTSYNAWGWMSRLGNSWAESIDSITRQFARMYGYTMTYEGALAYAANGQEAYWLSLVESEMARI